ncbi:MAG: acyl-CoA thioesterase [Acidimicrobiia bacterium]|nr:acyl-CoA thioesterase [Acidimicrobiia bacterium]
MIHQTPIRVRFYELDPYRHLNHAVYIQYFEVGRIDLFRAVGWTLTGLADMGVQIVVSSIETKFLASGMEGDDLVVETWVEDVRRVSTRFGQRIVRGDEVLATQVVYGACVNPTGRPMRFPQEMTDALTAYLPET